MTHNQIITGLKNNALTFKSLFEHIPSTQIKWKAEPGKWSLLEILCHLIDEEKEDFRARTSHVLTSPHRPMSPIDPQGWVTSRDYLGQDYDQKLQEFFQEREASIQWLENLENPQWSNSYTHRTLGELSASLFLANWLAHDYLHIQQIIKLKLDYLHQERKEDLTYAGGW